MIAPDFDLWRTACAGNRSQSAQSAQKKRPRGTECAMDPFAAAVG